MIRFISAMIMHAVNVRVRMTESPEDALRFLLELEPELGDLQGAFDGAYEAVKTP